MLGKGQKLSQRTHNDDFTLSALLAGNDLNVVDERPDDVDRLCSSRLVVQDVFQLGDLPAVKIRQIRAARFGRRGVAGRSDSLRGGGPPLLGPHAEPLQRLPVSFVVGVYGKRLLQIGNRFLAPPKRRIDLTACVEGV